MSGAVLSAPEPLGIDLATPDPIPDEAIEAAVEAMRGGTLFRYAESAGSTSHAALLENEFAAALHRRYALGVNSCGSAMFLALHALGVVPGETVLMNSWTLAPVPGAVAHAGARAVLVETTPDLVVDLEDLDRVGAQHPGAVLLLSHMRGHLADMDEVVAICERHGLRLVEDCAHALGASWDGRAAGTFGMVGCFSTQGYKHLNSGEGGLLVTDDDEVAARAVLASGSYMLHGQHLSAPAPGVFARLTLSEANHSLRMTNLTAALLRPQLRALSAKVAGWNERYAALAEGLAGVSGLRLPRRPPQEAFVGSSLQFFLEGLSDAQVVVFCGSADALGVHVKWFGAPAPAGFTSGYRSWAYAEREDLPATYAVLARLMDVRVPLSLPVERCADVVAIIAHALATARDAASSAVSPQAAALFSPAVSLDGPPPTTARPLPDQDGPTP